MGAGKGHETPEPGTKHVISLSPESSVRVTFAWVSGPCPSPMVAMGREPGKCHPCNEFLHTGEASGLGNPNLYKWAQACRTLTLEGIIISPSVDNNSICLPRGYLPCMYPRSKSLEEKPQVLLLTGYGDVQEAHGVFSHDTGKTEKETELYPSVCGKEKVLEPDLEDSQRPTHPVS